METYKIINALRVQKEGQDYDYHQLTLQNAQGETFERPVNVSTKMIKNLLKQKQANVGIMTALELQMLVETASIKGTLEFKKAGDTFIASEYTEAVNVAKEGAKPNWVTPKAGEEYIIQETGYRIDYNKDLALAFDLRLARQLEREAMAYETSQQEA